MGFDRILFLEDVGEELDTLRIYVSDRGDYSYLQTYFAQKEEGAPLFFFHVTMQNHGGIPIAEIALKLLCSLLILSSIGSRWLWW